MRFIKNFEKFIESVEYSEPKVKPTTPTKPKVRPTPPSPIRRDKPSINPKPKAEKMSTFDDIAKRFINLMNKRGEDIKKFIDKQ